MTCRFYSRLNVTTVTAPRRIGPHVVHVQAEAAVTEAADLRTLEQVFRWATRREHRLIPSDVVIQDEYTHDVIFLASDDSALVFDTT